MVTLGRVLTEDRELVQNFLKVSGLEEALKQIEGKFRGQRGYLVESRFPANDARFLFQLKRFEERRVYVFELIVKSSRGKIQITINRGRPISASSLPYGTELRAFLVEKAGKSLVRVLK